MIFQFSDGEFSDPIATSLKMRKKINSFIVIRILRHFREIEQKSTSMPPSPAPPPQIFLHAFFFSPPTRKLAARSLQMVGTLAVHFTKASVKRELTALYYVVKKCEIFVQNWGAMWSMSTLRDFSKYQRIKSSLQRTKVSSKIDQTLLMLKRKIQ